MEQNFTGWHLCIEIRNKTGYRYTPKNATKLLNFEQNFSGCHICIEIRNKTLLKMTKLFYFGKKLYELRNLCWNLEHNSSIYGTKLFNSVQNFIGWHICIEIRNKQANISHSLLYQEQNFWIMEQNFTGWHIYIEIGNKKVQIHFLKKSEQNF